MNRVAAPLAAALAAIALCACGDGGAEPGASNEATLVLDFQPNAVHAGIYAAQASGAYAESGVALEIREPSASTDAPKLLAAGRAEFAILDIHDLAIARDRALIRAPADLEGRAVGVTGLPSDDAVLDSVLEAGGADPDAVDRITIGFEAVPQLSAGRLEAATAFWNAEGVALRRAGVDTREFRVDDYGAPRYPELVLVTADPRSPLADDVRAATAAGYEEVIADPDAGLDALLAGANGLDEAEQRAQLEALTAADAFSPAGEFDEGALREWADWDLERGIVAEPIDVGAAFRP